MRLAPTHSVAGNPNRHNTGVVLVRPDDEWATAMPLRDRLLVSALTAPGLAALGYPLMPTRHTQRTPGPARRLQPPDPQALARPLARPLPCWDRGGRGRIVRAHPLSSRPSGSAREERQALLDVRAVPAKVKSPPTTSPARGRERPHPHRCVEVRASGYRLPFAPLKT